MSTLSEQILDVLYDWDVDRETALVDKIMALVKAAPPAPPVPTVPTVVPVDEDGELTCTCGSHQIQELGTIVPGGVWWYHVGQDAESKTLTLGGWEWESADGIGFECRDCQASYDALPEGWDVEYS